MSAFTLAGQLFKGAHMHDGDAWPPVSMNGLSANRTVPCSGLRVLAWPAPSRDDLNPYVTLMYSAFGDRGVSHVAFTPLRKYDPEVDIFHVQWPEAIFWGRGGASTVLAMLKARHVLAAARQVHRKSGSVVLTVHNLEPHAILSAGQKALWSHYYSSLLAEVDLIVSLSSDGHRLFTSRYPAAVAINSVVVPHPSYEGVYPDDCSPVEAKTSLDLPQNAFVISTVGSVRASKNVTGVLSSFFRLEDEATFMLVAGGGDEREWSRVNNAAAGHPRVRLVERYLDDAELSRMLAATDLLVIGQTNTLNSGSVLLGLTMKCRVLAPSVPAIEELKQQVGDEWIMTYQGEVTANALERAVSWARAEKSERPANLVSPEVASNFLVNALFELRHRRSGVAGAASSYDCSPADLPLSMSADQVAARICHEAGSSESMPCR